MEDIEILKKMIKRQEKMLLIYRKASNTEDYLGTITGKEILAVENLIARNKELENRFLELIINGKSFKIKNDVKQLEYTDFGNNEFKLEVLEKWK